MANLSYFESRSGRLTCNAEVVFALVTDIRNFEQFIPEGSIKNWNAEKESCSFNVPMIGAVTVRLIEKEKFSKVVFYGDALHKNDFSLTLNISDNDKNPADVKVLLSADLNSMMKMMASKPIVRFLEILINEMESFRGWNDTKE
jgi:ribosome-associated toxin RatA of RatAB toxin-antitoxin module